MYPIFFRAGDSLSFLETPPDHTASAGWELHARLVPRTAGDPAITIDATAEGDDHRFTVSPATTAAWKPGDYTVVLWATKGADSITLREGQTTIRPDLRTLAPGADTRSQAARALADCKTALATFRATKGLTRSYQIGIRQVEFSSTAEIIQEITYWEREVNKEDIAAGLKNAFSGRIVARI